MEALALAIIKYVFITLAALCAVGIVGVILAVIFSAALYQDDEHD